MLQLWLIANTILWPFNIRLSGFAINLNVVVLTVSGLVWFWRKATIAVSSIKLLAIIGAFLIVSMTIALTAPCSDLFSKALVSAPILTFLAVLGWEIGRMASSADWLNLQKTATYCLLVVVAEFLAEMTMPALFPLKSGYRIEGKFSGLFQEPSHVGFAVFPLVAILLVAKSGKIRRTGMFALLGLVIFSRSSTLIGLIVAWMLYRFLIQRKLRRVGLLLLGAGIIVGVGAAIGFDRILGPTADRVAGVVASSDTDNISSLVYVQGWQDTWANFIRTHGLGLGFNMMGCHPLPDVSARELLALHGLQELNAEDASFQFGKIVSEAGVVGLIFYIVIIVWWVRLEGRLRKIEDDAIQFTISVQSALIFCFIASSFIRGASYFSGGLLLWLAAMSGASGWRDRAALRSVTVPALTGVPSRGV